jgi:hypothetical protein
VGPRCGPWHVGARPVAMTTRCAACGAGMVVEALEK